MTAAARTIKRDPAGGVACFDHADCDVEILDLHHPAPLSWFKRAPRRAPDWDQPVAACPNAHRNTHQALDQITKFGRVTTPKKFGPRVRELAHRGHILARAHGLTSKPTL